MMKTILTYSATIAVTIATFTVLAQTESSNKNYGKEDSKYAMVGITANNPAGITMQQAMEKVLAQRGGQITKTEYEQENGKSLYEIKGVDAKGKRYKVHLDVTNGQTLENDDN